MENEKYIEKLLGEMTLTEKIGMIHGATLFQTKEIERLGIPALKMSDGTMGVRMNFRDDEWIALKNEDDYTTYLPCYSAVASTWNRELAYEAGKILGEETRGRGKDVILAPGMNIKRNPLCGRNFEYLSEDPKVVEEIVVPVVKGIQESDVAACGKHFAANSQETDRLSVDTIVDEKTLNEIYFPGFKAAIDKGNMYTIMSAYNRLNGEQCSTSKKLLTDVLRKQWSYDGVVISDWGGVHDTEEAARCGLDIEMDVTREFDKHFMADALLDKVENGLIPEEVVDEKVRNILRLMLRLKMIGDKKDERKSGNFNTFSHQNGAYKIAKESLVLLKNEDNILPLNPAKIGKLAVIGANAARVHADGGGSAELSALYEITPLMGIKMLLGGNADVRYTPGYYVPGKGARSEISWQADSTKTVDENGVQVSLITEEERKLREERCFEEAVKLAKESDTVIFVGGLDHDYDVEGLDRKDMILPYNQDKVIEELLKIKPDMVIVMYAGSPVEMGWLKGTKGLLWSYYAGMEGGKAIADVLFGKENPSGKLAETFVKNHNQCSAKAGVTFGTKGSVIYEEGPMVGYRYYDTEGVDVNFCFGYGLSYTSFDYDNIYITPVKDDGTLEISCDVTNTGKLAGKEVVQLYVAPKSAEAEGRPVHELKAFEKIYLDAGETKKVIFKLGENDFSQYSVEEKQFVVKRDKYDIEIAASSRDVKLTGTVDYE